MLAEELTSDDRSEVGSKEIPLTVLTELRKLGLLLQFAPSSNGKTADSGSAYRGSNPCGAALALSSNGPGRSPLKAEIRVRFPLRLLCNTSLSFSAFVRSFLPTLLSLAVQRSRRVEASSHERSNQIPTRTFHPPSRHHPLADVGTVCPGPKPPPSNLFNKRRVYPGGRHDAVPGSARRPLDWHLRGSRAVRRNILYHLPDDGRPL